MIESQFNYWSLVWVFCSRNSNNFERALMLTSREIYKIRNNHAPPIMHDLFQLRKNTYNLRNNIELVIQNKKISNYGLETVSYRVLFLLAKLPSEHKNSVSLNKNKKLER